MIANTIQSKIAEALKAKDEIRLSTLRLLASALNYEFIAKQHQLSEEEELAVVRREVKKRKEAIEAYEKVGAGDRAEKEKKELTILQEFLPPELPESELINLVDQAIAETGAKTIREMGRVIGLVKSKAPGADGAKIAGIVKSKLGQNDKRSLS